MRAEKYKRATDAAREGILPGLLEGGGSLVTGIASGVTGLFSRPIEVRSGVEWCGVVWFKVCCVVQWGGAKCGEEVVWVVWSLGWFGL